MSTTAETVDRMTLAADRLRQNLTGALAQVQALSDAVDLAFKVRPAADEVWVAWQVWLESEGEAERAAMDELAAAIGKLRQVTSE